MGTIARFFAVSTLAASLFGSAVWAQGPRDEHHDAYVHHAEWKKGYHLSQGDWGRAHPIDYRVYHLSPPPRDFAWRSVDGNYVLASVATGVIASVVVASTVH